jgi:serine-type D-Ala-D-Ala carboxypeptidase/endopeptidase (penicillin-binding protein 4)
MPYGTRNRRQHRAWASALASLLVLTTHAATALAGPGDLGPSVASRAQAAKIGNSRVGIHIVDLATGDVLADYNNKPNDEGFMPASNMKLVTTGAALHLLGPDFKFTTELRRDGNRLIIVGGGDPGFADPVLLREMTPQLSANGFLDTLADHVARAGIDAITEIVVDDRIFDRDYIHSTWPRDQLNEPYCAQVNGLNFHLNTVQVFARPAPELGNPAIITVEPNSDQLNVIVKVNTTGRAGTQSIWLTRMPGTNDITALGRVRVNGSAEVTIHDSATLFAHLLADRLAEKGVEFAKDAPIRLARSDETIPEGELIVHVVTPIERAVRRCNTDSQNLYAESFFKMVGSAIGGEPGSWTNAAAMTRMVVIERLGAAAARSFVVADGSGLSRGNRITPQFMTAWLGSFYADPSFSSIFLASLAQPGEGTLRNRFADRPDNEVRAKTGYINGVRTMSGYVIDKRGGRAVAFSVLINDISDRTSSEHKAAKQLQESVVGLIDDWISKQSALAEVQFGG